jgi:hypothetical protein
MSSYSATATAYGSAQTSTDPPYTVTSTATASASSDLSESIAQEEANKSAQQLANNVAQNDANIISQALQISPTGVIGTYKYLNINFAFKTSINGQAEFNGLIIPTLDEELVSLLALQITSKKTLYYSDTQTPIPGVDHLATMSTNVNNYGGKYGDVTIRGVVYSSPTPKSVLSTNRSSSIDIQKDGYEYKIKITSNLKYFCSIPILSNTTYGELNKSITGIQVNDKTLGSVNIISDNGNIVTSYAGVYLSETYSSDYLWNYINLDFSNAYISGVSTNIYPVINPNPF